MTGYDLDRKMRAILEAVTPETSFKATADLIKLGFGARESFQLVVDTCVANAKRNK